MHDPCWISVEGWPVMAALQIQVLCVQAHLEASHFLKFGLGRTVNVVCSVVVVLLLAYFAKLVLAA